MTITILKEACEAYTAHMKEKGQSPSTLGTIQRTLALLVEEMGENREVGKILPVHVDKFFKSEKATMQPGKDGMKPRAQASILQIRRITRMALVWWKEAGFTERLALPSEEKALAEKKAAAQAKADDKPKKSRKAKTQTEAEPEAGESTEPQAAASEEE